MYSVVHLDYQDNGLEFRRTMFRSNSLDECWSYVDSYSSKPFKLHREFGERLFVFDKLGNMCFRENQDGLYAQTLCDVV
jgi:hypothetical protein